MISEQDKQAILNGAYGITRDGRKAFLIGFTENEHPVFEITTEGKYAEKSIYKYLTDFHLVNNLNNALDIIGLWQDKPEPFDLERALAGEPVLIRDGSKGYVFANLNDIAFKENMSCSDYLPLRGVIVYENNGKKLSSETWTLNGRTSSNGEEDYYDIIGMWKEPQSEPNTVTLTLPCPLKEPRDEMWTFFDDGKIIKSAYKSTEVEISPPSSERFRNGYYFGSKEDAQAWVDAMRNNRV